MAGTGAVYGVRDAGDVLVQHRVHVHVGAVPHLHAQLHALRLLRRRPRRLAAGAADTLTGTLRVTILTPRLSAYI